MSESSIAVANYFIRRALDENKPVTAMQVLKLVYIAHGWYLALMEGRPLIKDDVEAWQYGPVIPVLYHEIKAFKGNPCDSLLSLYDGKRDVYEHPTVKNKIALLLLDAVWKKYGYRSGLNLSSLTHKAGTPWDQVWNKEGGSTRRGAVIPNALIKKHYTEEYQKLNRG